MPSLAALVSNTAPAALATLGTSEPRPRSDAQRQASRTNGARSRGPLSEAGRRRSSQNAVRHGLRSKAPVLGAEDARHLAALRSDLLRRWPVATPMERHWLERLVACHLRQEKLEAIEFLAMDRFLFDTDEPGAPQAGQRLPSLATLLRYRRQNARDMEEAGRNLRSLIDGRLHHAGGTDGWEDEDDADAWNEGEGGTVDRDDDAGPCTDEPEATPTASPSGLAGGSTGGASRSAWGPRQVQGRGGVRPWVGSGASNRVKPGQARG
ncbi:MAG: hypothetical protein KDG89_02260 [Geminicoccaceae bacterium]|nr:hypothetical protein [Geminicoccaceae bacterium]